MRIWVYYKPFCACFFRNIVTFLLFVNTTVNQCRIHSFTIRWLLPRICCPLFLIFVFNGRSYLPSKRSGLVMNTTTNKCLILRQTLWQRTEVFKVKYYLNDKFLPQFYQNTFRNDYNVIRLKTILKKAKSLNPPNQDLLYCYLLAFRS